MDTVMNYANNMKNEIANAKGNEAEMAKTIEDFLSTSYEWVVKGLPNIFKPVEEESKDYSEKYESIEKAAKAMIRNYTAASASAGFITGLGGAVTLPVTLPADMISVMLMQMRLAAGLARLGGYDLNDYQVQTFVISCLTGQTVSTILKDTGINIGEKAAIAGIKKIPAEAIKRINTKVGFRMLTKFGETGAINLGKAIPVVGGVIGGGFDAATTKIIGNTAYKSFIVTAA